MYPHVAIATRNNLVGLACLLGSIAPHRFTLHISDASDTPITANPQFSRISAAIEGGLHYRHTTTPRLVQQRLLSVSDLRDDEWCLFLDDDLLYSGFTGLTVVLQTMEAQAKGGEYDFIQGFKEDFFNDRGYPDFGMNACTPHHRPDHPDVQARVSQSGYLDVEDCDPFRFDGGVFFTQKKTLVEAVNKVGADFAVPPGVEDDAVVQTMGNDFRSVVSTSLHFHHYGNDNAHWSPTDQKQFAVDKLTQGKS